MGNDPKEYGKERLTASALRSNIYRVLDQVLETGEAVEIERYGQILRIEPAAKPKKKRKSKLDNLPKLDLVVGDSDDLIHMDWSHEWRP